MTGISNLNILVQQGGNTQEVNQTKQQSSEHTQMVAAQEQMARNVDAGARVKEMEEPEKSYLKREKSKEKKGDQSSAEEKKQKKKKEEKKSASTGNFLDTVV
jgi:hypothetical protein